MPGFDGTGPLGLGPMTGRGMGFCVVRLPDEGPAAFREGVGDRAQETETSSETSEEVATMPAGDGTGPLDHVLRTASSGRVGD